MPESQRVNTLPSSHPILRFPRHEHPDLPLHAGVNGLCRDPDHDRALMITPGGGSSLIEFCVDARGLWLHVAEGVRGVHVNGRPIQRLACLHVGDTIHCEGVEMQLADPQPRAAAGNVGSGEAQVSRLWLRGHGGGVHGQCIALDSPMTVGTDGDSLRVEGAVARIGELQPLDQGRVRFTSADGQGQCRLNGWPVTDAVLRAGDQILFAPGCRYLVESPGEEPAAIAVATPRVVVEDVVPRRRLRVPWLLLAACLSALLLAALFWFGVK